MCGIAGIWHFNKQPLGESKLRRFTDSLAHRGPDGAGYKIFGEVNLGLGHRRLSILDLSDAGRQPMTYEESNLHISFNGEIYNFIELRAELSGFGYRFKTDSDTEVILAAYHKWGFEAFGKFNGMWAIALYDTATGKLLLCRDRFGVKPLYYSFDPVKGLSFASETYAFKFLDDFDLEFHENNLAHSLINPVMIEGSGNTIFRNVLQILPGHYTEVDLNTTSIRQKRWFQIPQRYNTTISFAEAVEEFSRLFQNSLALRLRSDVPVASALSGGLDSSSVYCMLQHISKSHTQLERSDGNYLKAFVATFKDTPQDEVYYAEQVIEYTKGQVQYIETDFNVIAENIESSCRLFNDITATPITVLSDVYREMKRSGITVSMDGHGVDEMLYGYKSLVGMAASQALYNHDQAYFDDLKDTYIQMFPESEHEAQLRIMDARFDKLKNLYGIQSTSKGMKHRLKSYVKHHLPGRKFYFEYERVSPGNWLNKSFINPLNHVSGEKPNLAFYNEAERELAIDFYYRNIPYNMRDFDRAAMQHGIEIRMPFMDYNLVNFCFSLPMKFKVGHGYTKRVLREAMKSKMPESVRTRKTKIGMGAPLNDWFNGPLGPYILDLVSSQAFLESPYWNGPVIKEAVERHCRLRSWTLSEAQRFWNIVNAYLISKK